MLKNIIYLTLVQSTNYIFPLLMLPYLVRVLGPEGYGKLMLSLAIIQYFIIATDYGFNLSSTKKIALAQTSVDINRIYTNTINAKIIIFVIGVLIILPVTFYFYNMTLITAVVLISLISVLGNIMFPIFLFQGLEKMREIMWITIFAKLIMTCAMFISVKNKNDIFMAAFIFTLQYSIPGVFSLCLLKSKKIVNYEGFKFRAALTELKYGQPLFITQMAVTFYTTFNTLLLGYFYTPAIVGQYVAADKLRMAAQSLLNPIQQVVFPRINKEKEAIYFKIRKYSWFIILPSLALVIISVVCGRELALWYLGKEYQQASYLFVYMMCAVPFISCSVIYGQWGLIVLGYERTVTKIYCIAALLHLLYSLPLVLNYSLYGMVASVLMTEAVVAMLMLYTFLKRKKYKK